MPEAMVVPLLASAVLALAVAAFHRRLPPVLATRSTTVALVVVTAAAVPTLWITAVTFLVHAPVVGRWLDSCAQALDVHHPVSPWLGVPAVLLSVIGLWRAIDTLRTYRSVRHREAGVDVVEDDDLLAFTLPGPGGRIVLSTSLEASLSEEELRVVLAHERAHGRHRHDRYLLVAQLAAALLAPLQPLVSRLRFSIERWADEEAVRECGDRRFVARTLGRVAVYSADRQPVLAFAGLGVAARMNALMAPPMRAPRSAVRVALLVLILSTAVFAGFQIRHLVQMTLAFCFG